MYLGNWRNLNTFGRFYIDFSLKETTFLLSKSRIMNVSPHGGKVKNDRARGRFQTGIVIQICQAFQELLKWLGLQNTPVFCFCQRVFLIRPRVLWISQRVFEIRPREFVNQTSSDWDLPARFCESDIEYLRTACECWASAPRVHTPPFDETKHLHSYYINSSDSK